MLCLMSNACFFFFGLIRYFLFLLLLLGSSWMTGYPIGDLPTTIGWRFACPCLSFQNIPPYLLFALPCLSGPS